MVYKNKLLINKQLNILKNKIYGKRKIKYTQDIKGWVSK